MIKNYLKSKKINHSFIILMMIFIPLLGQKKVNDVQTSPEKQEAKKELFSAAKKGDFKTVIMILKKYPDLINSKRIGGGGWSLLHSAKGKGDMIEYLLKQGADISARTDGGWTTLHSAAYYGTDSAIEVLLKNGADLEATNDGGATPLTFSTMWNKPKNTKILVKHGANVNICKNDGRTPLIVASTLGSSEIVSILLKSKKTDIHLKDNAYKRTALHFSALNGHLSITKQLLVKGASFNIKDIDGKTPLFYAEKYGHDKVAELLRSKGAEGKNNINKNLIEIVKKPIKRKNAAVWYLGRLGCAVKTKNHFLIFSYSYRGKIAEQPKLINGFVTMDEIKNLKTIVFAGGSPYWHHNPERYSTWQDVHKDITFIYSFKDKKGRGSSHYFKDVAPPDYKYLPAGSKKHFGDVFIKSIAVNAWSTGFFVEVDGVKVFFGGEMILFKDSQKKKYYQIVDSLKKTDKDIDIVLHRSKNFWDKKIEPIHLDGIDYLVKSLKPKLYFCIGSENNEYLHKEVKKVLKKYKDHTKVFAPEHRGDMIFYKK